MNAKQIKLFLWENGLTISEMARALELEYDATFDTIRNALTQMFYHEKHNAELARLVRNKFGIHVDGPSKPQTVREAVRRAA
jgi:hypothetical protein